MLIFIYLMLRRFPHSTFDSELSSAPSHNIPTIPPRKLLARWRNFSSSFKISCLSRALIYVFGRRKFDSNSLPFPLTLFWLAKTRSWRTSGTEIDGEIELKWVQRASERFVLARESEFIEWVLKGRITIGESLSYVVHPHLSLRR